LNQILILNQNTIITVEAAINYLPIDFIELDLAVFNNEYYDMIEARSGHRFLIDGLKFQNVVRARIQGLEFNAVLDIIPGNLKVNMAYTYLWARNLENEKALKYRPRHNFTSGIEFATRGFGVGLYFDIQVK
jgi:outer membrane receptor for ferrienterochelin and colicins